MVEGPAYDEALERELGALSYRLRLPAESEEQTPPARRRGRARVRRLLPGALFVVLCVVVLFGAVAPGLAWRLLPPRPLGVLILDKTVPDTTYRGHRAVIWLLNHLKLVHPGSFAPYNAASDYAGFVPLTRRAWSVRPLPDAVGANRVVYVADTYGVSAGDLGSGRCGGARTGCSTAG